MKILNIKFLICVFFIFLFFLFSFSAWFGSTIASAASADDSLNFLGAQKGSGRAGLGEERVTVRSCYSFVLKRDSTEVRRFNNHTVKKYYGYYDYYVDTETNQTVLPAPPAAPVSEFYNKTVWFVFVST